MPLQTITLNVDIPEGYEATGEFRLPLKGEAYLDKYGEVIIASYNYCGDGSYIILRKTWTPPACLKNAAAFAREESGEWYAHIVETHIKETYITGTGYWSHTGGSVHAESACKLAGETWTPPLPDDTPWQETLWVNNRKDQA